MTNVLAKSQGEASADVRDAFRGALEVCCSNLERARSLVGDAVARLLATFTHLRQIVDHQHNVLVGITESLRQNGKHDGFAGATVQLVHEFVAQIVRVSEESSRIIEQLQATGVHVDTIVQHADKIHDMARETRFIAINARIETQRAGESGRTFKVVAEEVKRLARHASDMSVRIRGEVSACHESLQLTHRTAAGLAAQDVTDAVASRGAIVAAIEKLAEVSATVQETLISVGGIVDEATRALQFEDMVNQLLTDTVGRLRTLSSMSREMVGTANEAGADFSALSRELQGLGRAPSVSQGTVEQGSVELF